MREGIRFLMPVIIWSLVFWTAVPAATPLLLQGSMFCLVQGRVEILNTKVKLRDGSPDFSGVAVWLTPMSTTMHLGPPRVQKRTLEQRDKRFVPHIMVVQTGTEVDFPNRDPFFHNVFSVYDGKPFDLGLYANGESHPVRFNRPGISHIFCNIHPQMSAIVVTVETPYFALSAPDGRYSIENVPAGRYQLHLWHERSDDKQLAAESRIVSVESALSKLEVIRLDEAGYIPAAHKNKYGQDYEDDRSLPSYLGP
jgi:plastocyanin